MNQKIDNNENNLAVKLPPQNIDAEQSLLGALMLDKDTVTNVIDIVQSKDFYKKSHELIFEVILELFNKREPIDLLTVSNRLKEKNLLEEAGGMSYLTILCNSVPTLSHAKNYANMIRKKRILRDLIFVSSEIGGLGYKEEEDVDVLLDQAEEKIFAISQHSLSTSFAPIKSSLEEAFERIEKLHRNDGTLRGVPSGFSDLDNLLAGFQKSDLIIIAARPSLGKTSLALNIASHVGTRLKIPVGIFSLEMSREQLVDRFIAAQAKVNLWRLRTGRLSDEGEYNDFVRIRDAMANLSESPIYIDDMATINIIQIKAMARRLQIESGLEMIIVDYLQLMQPRTSSDNMVQQITEISRSLKALARELNIPVIAISQLSRAVEQRPNKRPLLSDLRESGAIEQDADVVIFIHREDRYKEDSDKKNIAELIVAKHRNGPCGRIELFFNEKYANFESLDSKYAQTND